MLINRSNLHNYFSEFRGDDEKAEEKIHEDLRIIAMTCVSRKNIIGMRKKLKIYKFYYPKKNHRETFYLLSTHKFKQVLSLLGFPPLLHLLNNLK